MDDFMRYLHDVLEAFLIDIDTKVIVLGVKGNQVRMDMDAAKEISIHR